MSLAPNVPYQCRVPSTTLATSFWRWNWLYAIGTAPQPIDTDPVRRVPRALLESSVCLAANALEKSIHTCFAAGAKRGRP
ncbi:hypothetical protein RBH26_16355 [Natronolimnohabitans sp. A-GB9]|uniref:hypothetical protein n=1 Tax=Natronolimnohabitans sp. A-GB9 TaxID=3069757 RepID=UPI0027B771B4|nr:hypothetical protein [Natronolimnohabitans sp. A-GB9]MDQ2052050.1 hypothetical protein [Natronolimnohabitans sp. A-GB9]